MTKPRAVLVPLSTVAIMVAVWSAGALLLRAFIADQIGTYGLGQPYPDMQTPPELIVPTVLVVPLGALGGWAIHLRPPTGPILAFASAVVAAMGTVVWAAAPVGMRFSGDHGPVWESTVEIAWEFYGLATLYFATGLVIATGIAQLIRHRRAT